MENCNQENNTFSDIPLKVTINASERPSFLSKIHSNYRRCCSVVPTLTIVTLSICMGSLIILMTGEAIKRYKKYRPPYESGLSKSFAFTKSRLILNIDRNFKVDGYEHLYVKIISDDINEISLGPIFKINADIQAIYKDEILQEYSLQYDHNTGTITFNNTLEPGDYLITMSLGSDSYLLNSSWINCISTWNDRFLSTDIRCITPGLSDKEEKSNISVEILLSTEIQMLILIDKYDPWKYAVENMDSLPYLHTIQSLGPINLNVPNNIIFVPVYDKEEMLNTATYQPRTVFDRNIDLDDIIYKSIDNDILQIALTRFVKINENQNESNTIVLITEQEIEFTPSVVFVLPLDNLYNLYEEEMLQYVDNIQ